MIKKFLFQLFKKLMDSGDGLTQLKSDLQSKSDLQLKSDLQTPNVDLEVSLMNSLVSIKLQHFLFTLKSNI